MGRFWCEAETHDAAAESGGACTWDVYCWDSEHGCSSVMRVTAKEAVLLKWMDHYTLTLETGAEHQGKQERRNEDG